MISLQPKFAIRMYNYIVDTHCHLDLIEDKGLNLEEILENCHKNGVHILQNICTKFSNFDKILSYTARHKNIYCSIGLHPCYVSPNEFKKAEEIQKYCQKFPKIIGIGETGLDYFHDTSQISLQKQSFVEHIQASAQSKLPLIIHSRNADKDMAEILSYEQKNQRFPALLHCFSSTKELCWRALDLGIFISIAGIVTFKNAQELQEIIKSIPLEYLLIETDSPYLAPMPNRGSINQPSNTLFVAQKIAELKQISVEKLINHTTENFHRIFTRVAPIAS